MLNVQFSAVVGDFELTQLVGQTLSLPAALLRGDGAREEEAPELLAKLPSGTTYNAYLRLPINGCGVIILLAPQLPESEMPLTQMFMPVMSNLAKAVRLCRQYDTHAAEVAAQQARIEHSLRQSEENLRALIELCPIGVAFSSDGVTVDGNAVYLKMFGLDNIAEIQGRPLLEQIAPQCREKMLERINKRAQGLPVENVYETTGLRRDGSQFPFLVSARRVVLPERSLTFSFFIDLTDQKRTEHALRASNEMLHTVLENAPIRVFWKDTESRYLGCNTAFARDAGLQRPEELIGKDDFAMSWQNQASLYRADDKEVMESNISRLGYEEPQTTPDGHDIWLRTSKVPLHNSEREVIGILGIYEDITQQKRAEAQIRQLAFFDPLTSLPNRRLLLDRIQQAMSVSMRNGRHGALMLLDLDQFKTLNDTKGHGVGDKMLIEVSRRLQSCVREGDTVARLGGDEFVVVLETLSSVPEEAEAQAEEVAEKIRASLSVAYRLDDNDYHITPSIGITMFRGHQHNQEDLLVHADTAMYQAKAGGRNTIRFYDPQMQAALEARSELEKALRGALARREFQLYYQLQVDAQHQPIGAEVLLRWRHSALGMVSPGQFIPIAEESGLILPIGHWVLETACAQLARWQTVPRFSKLNIAVNVSARQFRQDSFVNEVKSVLFASGINPNRLKLELTESLVLDNVEDTISKMVQLKALGVRFSMDDFGTGYSSLSYLKRLPLEQIKIDQSFVRDITTDQNDAAIVQTIIAMAQSLGLNVIAEGVETEAQCEFLELRGCRAFQGYLFGKPVPIEELERTLSR
ncbi:MAG: EAL domain-containing protein [Nitrosomonadales bacterium]|nr:EAL domain-containing protein [Nitrosomonadales bacterium]